jgi:hypothetical protein
MGEDRHKVRAIPFRPDPAGGDGPWLKEHARRIGQDVNAILRMLVARYRREQESEEES